MLYSDASISGALLTLEVPRDKQLTCQCIFPMQTYQCRVQIPHLLRLSHLGPLFLCLYHQGGRVSAWTSPLPLSLLKLFRPVDPKPACPAHPFILSCRNHERGSCTFSPHLPLPLDPGTSVCGPQGRVCPSSQGLWVTNSLVKAVISLTVGLKIPEQ